MALDKRHATADNENDSHYHNTRLVPGSYCAPTGRTLAATSRFHVEGLYRMRAFWTVIHRWAGL
ncbi:MAG: hypothetical protein RSD99_25965, partial [Janthinobacterium sp.]